MFHDPIEKMVLHCCCAPCSCAIIELLLQERIDLTLFFYNPNIHPYDEYLRRKDELVRFALARGVLCIDGDYDVEHWFEYVKGYEGERERGERCSKCFYMRLLTTAEYATRVGASHISTTLGISRWKDFSQVTAAGTEAVAAFPKVKYLEYNWRKNGGTEAMHMLIKEEKFYRQTYCGCLFSRKNAPEADEQLLPK